ncbi:MAG: LytTR family DNA-binding domain-containing protein [Defluviitaleaceae bacterium]|nr:LytTR family DNA-binding domain-containing protein [Defluviitaleaceae bacterium]
MLDIYICEDDVKQRESTAAFIRNYCAVQGMDAGIALASADPYEIFDAYEKTRNPALFFLDIDLGVGINGIELACKIREQGRIAFIVFFTTHSEMTPLTFRYKVEALDFIVKDNTDNIKGRIAECVETALARYVIKTAGKTVKLATGGKTILLDPDEIILIETTHIRHKLRLHARNRILEFNAEMKDMEALFKSDARFIRCHKSYIINKHKIEAVNKKGNTVTLTGGNECPLSRKGKRLIT